MVQPSALLLPLAGTSVGKKDPDGELIAAEEKHAAPPTIRLGPALWGRWPHLSKGIWVVGSLWSKEVGEGVSRSGGVAEMIAMSSKRHEGTASPGLSQRL